MQLIVLVLSTKQEPNNTQKHKIANPMRNKRLQIGKHRNTHKKKLNLNQQALVHV